MGRGRPRKYPVKEELEDFAPVKRGRGRPKKNRTIEPDNYVVLSGDIEVLCDDGLKPLDNFEVGDTVVGSDGSHMISDIVYFKDDISTYGTSQYTQGMKQVCDCGNDCGNDCRCKVPEVSEVKRGRGRPKKNSTIEPKIEDIQNELADMEFDALESVIEPLNAGVFINEKDNVEIPTLYGKKVHTCPRCRKNPVLNFQDWVIETIPEKCICAECAK